jgi:hypothetical protein
MNRHMPAARFLRRFCGAEILPKIAGGMHFALFLR